jgi:hypothetical protein
MDKFIKHLWDSNKITIDERIVLEGMVKKHNVVIQFLQAFLDSSTARPIDEWHEDYGDCLFWKLPIEEPPYCGSQLDTGFIENYYTHFTRIISPIEVKEGT